MRKSLFHLKCRARMLLHGFSLRHDFIIINKGCDLHGINGMDIRYRTAIHRNCWLIVPPAHADPSLRTKILRIGPGCSIGRGCTISATTSVEIQEHVLFAPYVFISDNDHVFQDVTRPILSQRWTEGGSVVIEKNCWLGTGVVVLGGKGLRIGRNSVVGANSVVIQDIPPYSVAVGNPARVIRQYDLDRQEWRRVKPDE